MTSIKVPPLGESIVEATVSRWLKKEGDAVEPGDTLVELETDKITVEVPAMSRGVLAKRLKTEGAVVKVDEVLAELEEKAEPAKVAAGAPAAASAARQATPPAPAAASAARQATPPAPAAPPTPRPPAAPTPPTVAPVRASPAAQRLAAQEGLDLSKVTGTGLGGVVSKPDIIEQRDGAAAAPSAPIAPAPSQAPAQKAPTPPTARPAPGTRETREKMSTR